MTANVTSAPAKTKIKLSASTPPVTETNLHLLPPLHEIEDVSPVSSHWRHMWSFPVGTFKLIARLQEHFTDNSGNKEIL